MALYQSRSIRVWHSLSLLGLCGILFNHFLISAKLTPKGVPFSRAALYDPQKDFLCLDGTKLISFSFVNDDYCDCDDGSDEPGTAACSNGRFFCVNAGHISSYVQSSRVNDGICDCCDGSDEFDSVGCRNTCDEMGRAARDQAERAARLAKDGFQKRLEMSQQGKSLRQSKEEERSRLEVERQQTELIKEEKEKLKEVVETPEKEALEEYRRIEEELKQRQDEEEKKETEREAEDMFNLLDSNEDGMISVAEIQVRPTFDRNKDGIVSDEEATFFLNLEQEMSKDDFLKSGWLIAKPYFLMEKGMFIPPETHEDKDDQENEPPQPEETISEQETEDQDFEDDEAEDMEESSSKPMPEDKEASDQDEDYTESPKEAEEPEKPKYDEQTMELIRIADKARSEFHEAEKVLREVSNKLQELNDVLNLDFGDDERFSPLHGQCYDFEDREYVYTLCPFKDANQRGKNGGGVVNLGKWGLWSGSEVNKFSQMLYDKGQSCWNGPARSARIFITCGIENRVTSVTEPSRCEYQFEFTSPSACQNPDTLTHSHDEL